MIKSYYAEVDNSIYEKTSSMNAGLDSALELSKVSSSTAGVYTSRILIKFPLTKISSSILSGDILNPKYYMNLSGAQYISIIMILISIVWHYYYRKNILHGKD